MMMMMKGYISCLSSHELNKMTRGAAAWKIIHWQQNAFITSEVEGGGIYYSSIMSGEGYDRTVLRNTQAYAYTCRVVLLTYPNSSILAWFHAMLRYGELLLPQ